MAVLNVSNVGQTGLNWSISGLSSAWNTTNYTIADIATNPVSDGQSTAPSGVLGSQSPPSSGTNTFTPTVLLSGLTPNTHYGLFGCIQTPAGGLWFQAGSSTFWTFPQSPSTLTGLTTTPNDTYVHLTWNASTNATSYDISWSGGSSGSSNTTNTFIDVTGLINNSSYTFTVTPKNSNATSGLTSTGGSASGTSTPTTSLPSVPSSNVVATRIDGGFNLSWGTSSGATSYTLDYKYSSDVNFTEITGLGTTYTLTGRNYGTNHDFKVKAHNASGDSSFTAVTSAYTSPQTPSITEGTGSSTSINIIGNVGSNTWDWINVERYDSTGNTLQETIQIQANGGSVTFTGLTTGTTYKFKAKTQLTANSVTFYSINYSNVITTIAGGSRPSNFAWTNAKVTGGNINVSKAEWDSFQSKVNAFRTYKGLSTFSFTVVTANVTTISAAIYNEMRTKINDMSPPTTLPAIVTSMVTTIAASHFNGLRDSLNSIL